MADAGADTELITVRKYESTFEAHLARTKIESEGIDAVIVDEHLADYNMLFGRTMGGIRLLVRETDVARAREIVDVKRPPETGTDVTTCPTCGSSRTRFGLAPRSLLAQAMLALLIVATGLLALVFLRWRWRCEDCGHVWREPPSREGDDA